MFLRLVLCFCFVIVWFVLWISVFVVLSYVVFACFWIVFGGVGFGGGFCLGGDFKSNPLKLFIFSKSL